MKTKKLILTCVLLSPICCLAEATKTSNITTAHPTDFETVIALLPAIIFFLSLLVIVFKLKKGGVALSDLLAEKDLTPAIPPAVPSPNPPQSVSRLIVFLTGLAALIIGVCLTTFFIYCYFKDSSKTVDLSNLTTVIWGLGIGVIPYGANKVSSALK
jgi:hypothetical protein